MKKEAVWSKKPYDSTSIAEWLQKAASDPSQICHYLICYQGCTSSPERIFPENSDLTKNKELFPPAAIKDQTSGLGHYFRAPFPWTMSPHATSQRRPRWHLINAPAKRRRKQCTLDSFTAQEILHKLCYKWLHYQVGITGLSGVVAHHKRCQEQAEARVE